MAHPRSPAPSPVALRMRAYRRRRKDGFRVFRVTVDMIALHERAVMLGYIDADVDPSDELLGYMLEDCITEWLE